MLLYLYNSYRLKVLEQMAVDQLESSDQPHIFNGEINESCKATCVKKKK